MIRGTDACHLQVGQLYALNMKPGKFELVTEDPDEKLVVMQGEGDDRVWQQFSILKYEVLP
jgi:hypothetical protein